MGFTVSLGKIIKEFSLDVVYTPKDPQELTVSVADYNRPGLELTGHIDFFDKNRILIIGKKEHHYLEMLSSDKRTKSLDTFLSLAPPAMVFCRGLQPFPEVKNVAAMYGVAILVSSDATSEFTASLVSFLNNGCRTHKERSSTYCR